MNITRRDILKLAGGSALGVLFTPVPWKLLDDSAIWTQNWALTPQLPRGPRRFKYSVCSVCSGGCALKAKSVGSRPVSLTGVANDPVSHGVLCPMGIVAHHLPYHPLRISGPHEFSGKGSKDKLTRVEFEKALREILTTIKGTNPHESIAILDQRPGRVISRRYQEFLSRLPNAFYLSHPSPEDATLVHIGHMIEGPAVSLGFDFENSRTILSFGAPLFDGWGTYGRMMSLVARRKEINLFHVESWQSRTALMANEWLPLKPGKEADLALGVAHVIVREQLYPMRVAKGATDFTSFTKEIAEFTPESVCKSTGIPADRIIHVARTLAQQNPSIVIGGPDPACGPASLRTERAIACLNLLLGNIGQTGGIAFRKHAGHDPIKSTEITDVPDYSIRLLIIDSAESGYAMPWSLLERKLTPGKALVVSLSPFLSGLSTHADYIIPAPAPLESITDIPTPPGASRESFALSTPLLQKREGSTEPIDFINRVAIGIGLAGFSATHEDVLKSRAADIHSSKRGTVHPFTEGKETQLKSVNSADEFWTMLNQGAVWQDEQIESKPALTFNFLDSLDPTSPSPPVNTNDSSLHLVPIGWKGAAGHVAPIMSKVFQESNLRSLRAHAFVNPFLATRKGLIEGESGVLQTERGRMQATIHLDASVDPQVILVTAGPSVNNAESPDHIGSDDVLGLCLVSEDGTWRATQVKIEKA